MFQSGSETDDSDSSDSSINGNDLEENEQHSHKNEEGKDFREEVRLEIIMWKNTKTKIEAKYGEAKHGSIYSSIPLGEQEDNRD